MPSRRRRSGDDGPVVAGRLRATSQAANTPASAPDRCPCHETPSCPGSTPSRMPPHRKNTTSARTICVPLRRRTADEQVREPAEDHPGHADGHAARRRGEPHPQTRDDPDHRRDHHEPGDAVRQHQEPEDQERQRCSRRGGPSRRAAAVPTRCRRGRRRARDDAVLVEPLAGQLVVELDDPQHRGEREDRAERLQRLGREDARSGGHGDDVTDFRYHAVRSRRRSRRRPVVALPSET